MKHGHIIEKMTLLEKAMFMTGKSTWETRDFPKLGVPSIFMADGPHGIRKQLGAADHLGLNESIKATCFPTAATVANSWDMDLAKEIGKALGKEARTLGVDVLLGPGMNIKRNPLCGRNFEYFSEDPLLTGKLAGAYVDGIQSQGVSATPKHFAVNSQELRRMSNDSIVDERTLREIYLKAFEIVVKENHPKFMMTSYNQLNGEYTNEHEHLLQTILYGEWQYDGVIVTDWGGSNDHVEGVRMGSHVEMPGTGMPGAIEIEEAVLSGRLSEDILNQRVDELLDKVFELAKNEVKADELPYEMKEKHHALARKVAQESIVLLKNEQSLLPLQTNKTIGVIGDFAQIPRYQGAGSSVVNTTQLETINNVIKDYPLNVIGFEQGYLRSGKEDVQLLEAAVALAKSVDVPIVMIGLTEITESEGMDREHMNLDSNQITLIEKISEVNSNVIIVLAGGSPVELPFESKVPVILHSYLSGQAGATAILDIITGKITPSGKLAETYPLNYQDVSNALYYPGLEKTSEYREALYVGYRYFDKVNQAVQYPFGYGLSYTQFEFSDLEVKDEGIELTVTNVGDYYGAEIVQVYIQNPYSESFGEIQSLAGFNKIWLKPQESKRIKIPFGLHAFEYFNIETNKWEVAGGEYIVTASKSSREHVLTYKVIKQSTAVFPTNYLLESFKPYRTGQVTQIENTTFELLIGRAVPESNWNKQLPLGENDTLSQMYYAKGFVARNIYKVLTYLLEQSIKKGEPNLNLYFNYNMTFRAMQKMTGGMVNHAMVQDVLTIVNGSFWKGITRLIRNFMSNKKTMKQREEAYNGKN